MLQEESDPLLATLPVVAMGSNEEYAFGGACEIVARAPAALEAAGLKLRAMSELLETPCFPPGHGPDFVNAAALFETDLAPERILEVLHRVEAEFRRERHRRWGPRTLDLDLIAVGGVILPGAAELRRWIDLPPEAQLREAPEQLILPHPRLQDRAFVLIPMAQIVPEWRHPLTGKTVRQMLADLPEAQKAAIRPIRRRPRAL